MMSSARTKVLSLFKTLHRTREVVFRGDDHALKVTREKINEEFRKHSTVSNPEEIKKLLQIASESNDILRTKVLQAQEIRPQVYQIRDLSQKCINAREGCGRPDCHCVP
jgi:complex III assembly factor LYRM7